MRLTTALLADYANVSREGKLNVLGLFDSIYASAFPAKHLQMQLVMRFEVPVYDLGKESDLEIRLVDGDGKDILRIGGKFKVSGQKPAPGEPLHSDEILPLNNVIFPKPGKYQFVISINKHVEKEIFLTVNQISQPPLPNL